MRCRLSSPVLGAYADFREIPAYLDWIATLFDGRVHAVLAAFNAYTIQIIPLILLLTMSFSFGKAVCKDDIEILYYPVVAFCAYLIFLARGALTMTATFGTTQTFLSIAITLISFNALHFFRRCKFADLRYYIPLPKNQFSVVYRMAFPCAAVLLVFASAHLFFPPIMQDIAANFHLRLSPAWATDLSAPFCTYCSNIFTGLSASTAVISRTSYPSI